MTTIDTILLLVLFLALITGYKQGLLHQVFALFGLLASVVIAYYLYPLYAGDLSKALGISFWLASILLWLLLFLGLLLIIALLLRALNGIIKLSPLSVPNKILGALLSVVTTAVVLSGIINVYEMVGENGKGSAQWEKAEKGQVYMALRPIAPHLWMYVSKLGKS